MVRDATTEYFTFDDIFIPQDQLQSWWNTIPTPLPASRALSTLLQNTKLMTISTPATTKVYSTVHQIPSFERHPFPAPGHPAAITKIWHGSYSMDERWEFLKPGKLSH